jgi:LysM repeat protein
MSPCIDLRLPSCTAVLLAAYLIVGGCSNEQGNSRSPPYGLVQTGSIVPASPVTHASDMVIVQPGDTLYGIARRNNVTVYDLMITNDLGSAHISVGQTLYLPTYRN